MDGRTEPLLSNRAAADGGGGAELLALQPDIEPIRGVGDFYKEFLVESKKLWLLAGPAIFTSVAQYSLGAVTQLIAGQVSTLALAAVSVENSVIAGFSFGVMLGMGSALETLCGQAYGTGQLDMLGTYMQRSWVILNSTALVLTILYVFAAPFLKLIGQADNIAEAAGELSIWMIPQLYAYTFYFPISKFLQAQSKMMVMALIALVALVLHALFSWLLMLKLGWGMAGGAIVLNASWWFIVVAQLVYIFSGTCGRAWSGFTWKAFHNLWAFVRLSVASAVMLWYASLSVRLTKCSILIFLPLRVPDMHLFLNSPSPAASKFVGVVISSYHLVIKFQADNRDVITATDWTVISRVVEERTVT
ncbi:Protein DETOXIFICATION 30 [Asimina triloba]